MDLLKSKSIGSKAALQSYRILGSYCRRPDGWTTILCLSLFLVGVLVGTASVSTQYSTALQQQQQQQQQPFLKRWMGRKQGTVDSANLKVLAGLNQLLSRSGSSPQSLTHKAANQMTLALAGASTPCVQSRRQPSLATSTPLARTPSLPAELCD
jgi:predicted PurR-regulated permease PerM